jgi:hypothetical protein
VAVTTPRETRTDPFADLSKKVEVGFARTGERIGGLDKRVDALDKRMDGLDKKMDAGFARVDTDIRELRGEVKWLIYGLVPIGASSVGTFIHSLISWFA